MKCLVNYITRRKNGNISTKSKEVDANSIGIGRATDQEIFLSDLRIAYKHAEIVLLEGKYYIKSLALSGIRLNNAITSSVLLTPGVVVQIGNYELKVIEKPGYDLVVELEQVTTSEVLNDQIKLESKLDLNQTKLNKRLLSWIGFATIFVLFFILPLSSSLFQPIKDISSKIPLIPTDAAWKSGSMASVHHFFKNDCRSCHQDAFVQVKDEACTSCHKDTHIHANDNLMVNQNLNNIACQDCHKEHNGTDGMIMPSSNNFCSDCHADLKETLADKTKLLDASDFGDDHPEFRASIPYSKFGKKRFSRISMDNTEKLKEKNAVVFSHKAHLQPYFPARFKELTKNGAEKMACMDCHVPDSGGKRMIPINFEDNCESCHKLEIGKKQARLKLPHEATTEVYYYIEQYYKSLALDGGITDTETPTGLRTRRRAGQAISSEERLVALNWASKKSKQVAEEIFNYTLCKTCHIVTSSENATPPWNISAVYTPDLWFPKANFTHSKHTTMECLDCHNVEQSEVGEDVLMPKIADCRSCHAGAHNDELLASGCIDCHSFHIGKELLAPPAPTIVELKATGNEAEEVIIE